MQPHHSDIIQYLRLSLKKRKILTIDGPAGSGKSTLAEQLRSECESQGLSTQIIHMDDIYNGWDRALSEDLTQALLAIIRGFFGGVISFQKFDWQENRFQRTITFASPEVLILEGVGSGQREIRNSVTASIWIEADPDVAFERVISRDGEKIRPFMEKWLVSQELHFQRERTKSAAQFLFSGD
jgi:uridine kinase